MNSRHLALAAGFAAVLGLSLPALASQEARMGGYAPTVKEMLQSHEAPVAPTMPLSAAQPQAQNPAVGMKPVYSNSVKKHKKKKSTKKKAAIECPPGFSVKEKGCVQDEVQAVEQPAPSEVAAPAVETQAPAAEMVQPATPDCPTGMSRDVSGNCASQAAAPQNAIPDPAAVVAPTPIAPTPCPAGTMSDVNGNCLPLPADATTVPGIVPDAMQQPAPVPAPAPDAPAPVPMGQ